MTLLINIRLLIQHWPHKHNVSFVLLACSLEMTCDTSQILHRRTTKEADDMTIRSNMSSQFDISLFESNVFVNILLLMP